MVVVFVVVGGTEIVVTGTSGSENIRRGGIETPLWREGVSRRGDLGGDVDSETVRPLAVVTGRGIVGSVTAGIVVLFVVTGNAVVTGVTCAFVVFLFGGVFCTLEAGVPCETPNTGTTGSERMRRGGLETTPLLGRVLRRGDLGGDVDSDTVRSLAVVVRRSVVGSVFAGIVVVVFVSG